MWTFGSNQNGELGTGRVDRGGPFTLQVAALHHERIVQVACGAQHTAALTAGGSVYVWGSNAEGKKKGFFYSRESQRKIVYICLPHSL